MRSRRLRTLLVLAFALLCTAIPAHASSGGASMPWDSALQAILDNLSGTVARVVILILVVVAGIMWAASDHGTGIKRLSQIIFGAGIAMGAVSFLTSLGFVGALF